MFGKLSFDDGPMICWLVVVRSNITRYLVDMMHFFIRTITMVLSYLNVLILLFTFNATTLVISVIVRIIWTVSWFLDNVLLITRMFNTFGLPFSL